MSSAPSCKSLSCEDLEMLRGVLDQTAFETGERNVAALLVIRLFQSGMSSPDRLAKAVRICIADNRRTNTEMRGHLNYALIDYDISTNTFTGN